MQGAIKKKTTLGSIWKRFRSSEEFGALIPLVILLIVVEAITTVQYTMANGVFTWGAFLSWNNIRSILNLVPFIGICCLGNALVILTNSADMSVGTTAGMACMILGFVIKNLGAPWWVGLIAGVVTGFLLGFVKSYFILDLGLPSFIVTMGLGQIIGASRFLLSGGYPYMNLGKELYWFGHTEIVGLYLPFFIAVLLYVVVSIMLAKTTFGRKIKAVGDNAEVASLSGINVKSIKKFAYLTSGTVVAIAGLLLAIRMDYAQPTTGTGWESNCMAACAIGGVSLSGGRGSGICIAMGMLTMMFLENAIVMMGIPTQLATTATGLFLMMAASLDMIKSRQKIKAEATVVEDDEVAVKA